MSSARFGDRGSTSGSEPLSCVSQQPSGEQGTPPDYTARLESFQNYPPPHLVNILHLARDGFIHNPTPMHPRGTSCVQCKKVVNSWKEGDRPFCPEFHVPGCQFIRPETPSEHSGSITDMSENFVRASVNSNEESTKPLETMGYSGVPPERSEIPLSYKGMESRLPSTTGQVPARQAYSVPAQMTQRSLLRTGIPPTGQYSMTTLRAREEGGSRTSELEHIQAQHHLHPRGFGHRSLSPTPQSFPSTYPASSFFGSSQTGTFSNVTYPPQVVEQRSRHSSYGHSRPQTSAFQSPTRVRSGSENPLDILNTLDMRDALNRLYTFEQFWSEDNEFRNYRLLVVCGFFCIGQGDAVECFCCHVVIANWTRNDNPRTRHTEMSAICRFMRDEECGNIPLPVERRRPRTPASSIFPPPSTQRSRSSRHSSPYSSHRSSPHSSFIAQPSMEGAVGLSPTHHSSMQGASGPTSIPHSSIQSSMGPVAERYSNPTPQMYQRSNLLTEFPCLNPANASMREERVRLQTFFNGEFRRRTRLRASNETLARAGLYYVGEGDSVKCWFCDGGLRQFQPEDDPWVEHAKFFPECEYLLQQRGPEWITRISAQNPNVQRPILPQRESRILPQVVSSPTPLPPPPPRIEDPDQLEQYRRQLLEEGMQSEPAQRAREMGYSEDRIRHVQWQKILMDDCTYQSSETLINALTPDTQTADSPTSSGSSGASGGASPNVPVIEMPDTNVHFHSSNIVGPTVINGQYYPPSTTSNSTSNVHYSTTTHHHSSTGTGLFINGQPMEEFMANAFDHPFFRGEMDHLLTPAGSSSTVVHTNPSSHSVHYHQFMPPVVRPPVVHHYHNAPGPRAPTATQQSHAPTVPPPPRPPLQAIHIPRRNAPSSSNAGASTSSAVPPPRPPLQAINIPRRISPSSSTGSSTSASSASTAPSGGASGSSHALEGAAAQNRLAELERERTCKICLNAQSVVLFRPCGHICCCEDCARRVNTCPVCRRQIQQYIRTYHA